MNSRNQAVQKARYLILVPPLAWLIFSIWLIGEIALPQFAVTGLEIHPPNSSYFGAVFWGLVVLFLSGEMLTKRKRNILVPIEQKGLLPFALGGLLLGIGKHLQLNNYNYIFILALVLTDILPIVVIVTLLQGKSFGKLRL
ncbi:MAG: hypothetical protein ACOYZ6_00010 [Chloroflexota bacterium]